jgi:hypothetical protein
MDGEDFDALVQRVVGGSSRRRLVRAGFGALAASALGVLGMSEVHETEAARKPRKHRKSRRPQSSAPPPPPPPPPAPAPAPAPALFGNQTPCSGGGQCASGTCAFNGRGQVCCSPVGGRCAAHYDCCGATNPCDFATGTCL